MVLFVLVRAVTYATLFVGLLLVFVPARLLTWSGITRPDTADALTLAGAAVTLAGAALALACVLVFAVMGKGTPAPFDPPRRLVTRGPYAVVRNPMYLGAGTALLGAAIVWRAPALLAYLVLFLAVTHVFVVTYEEPTLTRLFGEEYQAYRARVGRWLPRFGGSS